MVRSAVLGLFVLLSACASNRATTPPARNAHIELTEKGHGLFVGHTDNGEVVVAASHYNAMNGLAVLDTELGIPSQYSQGMMLCSREVPTGTHVPRWICRYQSELEIAHTMTQVGLVLPLNSPLIASSGAVILVQGGGRFSKTATR